MDRMKSPRLDESMSWTLLHLHFKATVEHNNWVDYKKTTHLLPILQGQAIQVLHSVSTEARYENTTVAPEEGQYGHHQLVAAYTSQLKTRAQLTGESLQESAATITQLAHCTHTGLPQYYIRREAARAFIDGIEEQGVKFSFLMGGERMLEDALKQALGLKCPWGHGHQALGATRLGNLYASSVGASSISGGQYPQKDPLERG
jgi:hypothetical protein